MTKRKHLRADVDADDYGFDLVGNDWTSATQERMCLVGLDSIARDLYYTCLRPFTNARTGDVQCASYYRFIKLMAPVSAPRGGRRFPAPTIQQLRDALQRLEQSGLVKLYPASSMCAGALQIRVVRRFGVALPDPVGTGVRPGVQ